MRKSAYILYLTRVNGVRGHSVPLQHASELLCEVNVGQLAAAVGEERKQVVVEILEVQLLVLVAGAGEIDHSARWTLFQPREKKVGH